MIVPTLGKFVVVDIHTPMSSSTYDFMRVRKSYFDTAKKRNGLVLVRTPYGERVLQPDKMKHQKIVKEVFLFKDKPMDMYEIIVPHCEKKDDDFYVFH